MKNLKSEKPSGTKIEQKGKKYSALNVHIAPPEKNNINLAVYYTNTYANQSLYTNLMNNFVKFEVSVYVTST